MCSSYYQETNYCLILKQMCTINHLINDVDIRIMVYLYYEYKLKSSYVKTTYVYFRISYALTNSPP